MPGIQLMIWRSRDALKRTKRRQIYEDRSRHDNLTRHAPRVNGSVQVSASPIHAGSAGPPPERSRESFRLWELSDRRARSGNDRERL
jgi:hypothetical protein